MVMVAIWLMSALWGSSVHVGAALFDLGMIVVRRGVVWFWLGFTSLPLSKLTIEHSGYLLPNILSGEVFCHNMPYLFMSTFMRKKRLLDEAFLLGGLMLLGYVVPTYLLLWFLLYLPGYLT